MDPEGAPRTEPIRLRPRGPEFGSTVVFTLSATGEPSPPIWRITLPRVEVTRTVGQVLDAEAVLAEVAARAAYGSGGFSLVRLRDHLRDAPEVQSEKRKPVPNRNREVRVDQDAMPTRGSLDSVRLTPSQLEALEPFLLRD